MGRLKTQLPSKEEILTTWNRAFLRDKKLIPMVPAVYVLVSRNEILYIGTSKFLYKRVVLNIQDHPISLLVYKAIKCESGKVRYENIREYLDSEYSLEVCWWNFNPSEAKKRYKLEYALIMHFKPPVNGFPSTEQLENFAECNR